MPLLLSLMRERAWLLAGAGIAGAGAAMLALVPLVALWLLAVELLAPVPDRDAMLWAVWLTVGGLVLRWLLMAAGGACSHAAAFDLIFVLRLKTARHLGRLPLGTLSRIGSGDLKRVLHDDIDRLEMVFAHMLPDMISALTATLAGIVVLLAVDWRLGLAAMAPIPLALTVQGLLWRWAGTKMAGFHDDLGRMNAAIVEVIRAIPVIKTFGRNAVSLGRLQDATTRYSATVADFTRAAMPAWIAFTVLLGGSLAVMLPVGGMALAAGTLDPATFLFCVTLGVGVCLPLLRVVTFGSSLQVVTTAMQRLGSILDAPPLPEGTRTEPPSDTTLSFEGVSFSYDDKPVLTDVTVTFPQGTHTALVGRSGAGKTTLAHLAARFWVPDRGTIRLGGVDIADFPLATLNTLVACVFQEVFLFHDTVLENIRLGHPQATREDVIAVARAAQIHDVIMGLPDGYDTVVAERGHTLSGGQRQRLSIARALLKDAPVVILDEATAFADPLTERAIHEAIARLCRGRTVITIAHRLSTLRHADRVVVMDAGRVVGEGEHSSLLRDCAVYARLWEAKDQTEREAAHAVR
ncbi:ABC transporter ATP-binding protein [Rhodospira trueperi]|uniref:ATP-binding cassette, subfamily B n=1 Tax=Rhodospira trueperi TaxID=69960 RepID=A0A1G7DJ09_9PROT|nr:ABC transporter ATP-binding protein [Rhodospira trueperi]SDE51548.1 ATP-binding cassette, subfamily B [Rhodospira trueperi]